MRRSIIGFAVAAVLIGAKQTSAALVLLNEVVSTESVAIGASMAIGPNDVPQFAYYRAGTLQDIRYVSWNGSA